MNIVCLYWILLCITHMCSGNVKMDANAFKWCVVYNLICIWQRYVSVCMSMSIYTTSRDDLYTTRATDTQQKKICHTASSSPWSGNRKAGVRLPLAFILSDSIKLDRRLVGKFFCVFFISFNFLWKIYIAKCVFASIIRSAPRISFLVQNEGCVECHLFK